MSVSENNKRIAKNTLILYVRMFFTMAISLFTSRIVLQTLGVENYGIYNVVGGIITMLSFINGGMVAATQRYLTFGIGKDDIIHLKKVFSTSLQIHFIIALLIVLLGETVGLWFLYEKLVIPPERMTAAVWVYQCSIVASVVNIMSVPYNAVIIAHEKMSAFAYISILEVVLNLIIVYLLYIVQWDKLIAYAILILFLHLTIRFVYTQYCNKHFEESHYQHSIDKALFKEMFTFAGWSFWGNFAGVLYTHGLNMMLNIFFGPVVNASRGIAVQVQGAVQRFVTNFQVALNPQITKNYAGGNLAQMHSLMFRSARFSFYLLYFIALPILLETHYILNIWLQTVPPDAVVFTRWMIAISLIYTFANPCVIANQATGKVKLYQMVVGMILLLILPISYVVLKLGAPAYSVFIVHFCVEMVAQIARMYMLRKLIKLPIRRYLKHIYLPVTLVVIISFIIPFYLHSQLEEGLMRLIVIGLGSVISVFLTIILVGLTREERDFFFQKMFKILRFKK